MKNESQLSLDALLELREVEVAFAQEAVQAIAAAGVEMDSAYLAEVEVSETSPSWIGQTVAELQRLERRAQEDLPRLKRLLARILHENVDAWLDERRAEAKYAEVAPPRRVGEERVQAARATARARLPRTPKAEPTDATVPTKKLTDRQRDLLQVIVVGPDNIGRFDSEEHVPDWAALKAVMVGLGSKWKTRTGFQFPDDVDGAEVVRIALETGEIIDWDGAGFFPTPDGLADDLVARLVDMPEVPHILEPSAGTGSLCRAVRRRYPHAEFYALELIDKNRQELERLRIDLVGRDWMRDELNFAGESVHAIVMNPPFAKRADVLHITKAIEFLGPGGQLAAIASAGVKYRSDRLAEGFRALVAKHGGVIEDNPEGAFLASGTGVRTVSIWLRKGAA